MSVLTAPITLYGLDGTLLAWLENAREIVQEVSFSESDANGTRTILTFEVPVTDEKTDGIIEDAEVEYRGERYVVFDIDRSRSPGKIVVGAEGTYIRLIDRTWAGRFDVTARTAWEGLDEILAISDWNAGTVEDASGDLYSLSETNRTVLWLVRAWARITDLEIEWDTTGKVVNLRTQLGVTRPGVGFRYAKNLKEVRRRSLAPQATRIIPFGRNGLTISSENGGSRYLEDYSWYVANGLTQAEAEALFRKDYVFTDDRFLTAKGLKKYAQKKLRVLSRPIVAYEVGVVDLSALTGVEEGEWSLGDTVKVRDPELKVNVSARIVRYRRFHAEAHKNEVELEYLVRSLSEDDNLSDSVGLVGSQLVKASNNAVLTVTTTQQTALDIALTAYAFTNGVSGFNLRGTASADLTLTVDVLYGTSVIASFPFKLRSGTDTAASSFVFENIPEGSQVTRLRLSTSTGTFTVAALNAQYWIDAIGIAGGAGAGTPDVVVFEDVDDPPQDASGSVTVDVDAPEDVSEGETVTDPPQAASDTTNPVTLALTAPVAASGDDGFITATPSFDSTGVAVEAGSSGGTARSAFLRFALPFSLAGRTITSATIEGIADTSDSGALTKIKADTAAAPAAPTTKADMDGRARTTAAVDWDPSATTAGNLVTTVSFASVVQELVDAHGASLTHLLVFIENDASPTNGRVTMRSWDHSTSAEPLLRITFT